MNDITDKIHLTSNAESVLDSKNAAVILKKRLSEYIASLELMDGEREHQKDIADMVMQELDIDKKIFKKTATLMHKDKFTDEEGTLDACRDLYDKISTII